MVSPNVFSDETQDGKNKMIVWIHGNELMEWLKNDKYITERNVFIFGVVEALQIFDRSVCIKEHTTGLQLTQITYNYMVKNPTEWTYSGSFVVINAIREAYPCKK